MKYKFQILKKRYLPHYEPARTSGGPARDSPSLRCCLRRINERRRWSSHIGILQFPPVFNQPILRTPTVPLTVARHRTTTVSHPSWQITGDSIHFIYCTRLHTQPITCGSAHDLTCSHIYRRHTYLSRAQTPSKGMQTYPRRKFRELPVANYRVNKVVRSSSTASLSSQGTSVNLAQRPNTQNSVWLGTEDLCQRRIG